MLSTIAYSMIFGSSNVLIIVPIVQFYRHRNIEIIRNRLPTFSLIIAFCCWVLFNHFLALGTGLSLYSPCLLMFMASYHFIPIAMISEIIRMCYLLSRYFVSMAKLQISQGIPEGDTIIHKMNIFEKAVIRAFIYVTYQSHGHDDNVEHDRANGIEASINGAQRSVINNVTYQKSKEANWTQKSLQEFVEKFGKTSKKGMLKVILLLVINGFLMTGLSSLISGVPLDRLVYHPNCKIVMNSLILWASSIIYIILVPAMLYIIRNVDDFLWMKREISLSLWIFVPFFIGTMVLLIIDEIQYIQEAYLLASCVPLLLISTTIFIPLHLSRKSANVKSNRIVISKFESLLENDTFRQSFKEYLAKVFCIELILFWEDYRTFHQKVHSIQRGQTELQRIMIRRQCKFLGQKYLSGDTQYELNLPSKTVKSVQKEINEGRYTITMFDEVLKQVVGMMYENNVTQFISKYGKDFV